jgi:hypothetical protein
MNLLLSEVSSVTAEAHLDTVLDLVGRVPEAAVALLIAVLLAVYGLVRFDLENHLPSPR